MSAEGRLRASSGLRAALLSLQFRRHPAAQVLAGRDFSADMRVNWQQLSPLSAPIMLCRWLGDSGPGCEQHEVRGLHRLCQAHLAGQPGRGEGSRQPADRMRRGEAAPRPELARQSRRAAHLQGMQQWPCYPAHSCDSMVSDIVLPLSNLETECDITMAVVFCRFCCIVLYSAESGSACMLLWQGTCEVSPHASQVFLQRQHACASHA